MIQRALVAIVLSISGVGEGGEESRGENTGMAIGQTGM